MNLLIPAVRGEVKLTVAVDLVTPELVVRASTGPYGPDPVLLGVDLATGLLEQADGG
jgi:hypothetical protein